MHLNLCALTYESWNNLCLIIVGRCEKFITWACQSQNGESMHAFSVFFYSSLLSFRTFFILIKLFAYLFFFNVFQVQTPQDILKAKRLIFPGVGAFAPAMDVLNKKGYGFHPYYT